MACCGLRAQDVHCSIQLLNGSEVNINLQSNMKGCHVLDRVFKHLNLEETDFFGLRFIDNDNQTHWLEADKPILKQMKNVNPLSLYFGVKFYIEDPCKLSEEVTRYQFFLQLKMDMLQGRLPSNFNVTADLCAYAVQSELGDYDPELHPDGYVSEFRFVPNQTEDLEKAIAENHKKLRGQQPSKAELGFLDKAKRLEMYGVDLYPVFGEDKMEYFLGTTPSGVVVYRNKTKVATYFWSKITQLTFRQTEFRIIIEDNEYVWQLPSRTACKNLFQYYIEQHTFFRTKRATLDSSHSKSLSGTGRHSFRTQHEALQNSRRLTRPEPQVQRVPSRRYLRRVVSATDMEESQYVNHSSLMNGSVIDEDGVMMQSRITKTVAPEPVQRSQSQLSGRESPVSGVSIRSVPWEESDGGQSDRGMYTQRGESPVSLRSKSRRPHSRSSSPGASRRRYHRGDRSGSETDSISSRKYRYRRSLTGSEASEDESTYRRRRRRRRSRSRDSSASEGDNRHRSRRSRSRDHMVDSEAQWNAVQTGSGGPRGEMREPGDAVVKNLKNSYPSPDTPEGYKWYKERSQLADIKASNELRKHIQLGLQDPQVEREVQDIPYTQVITDDGVAVRVSHSPTRRRSRHANDPRRRSRDSRGDYTDDNASVQSAKGSVHSLRSAASRKTDSGHYVGAKPDQNAMPLDLVQSGQDAQTHNNNRPPPHYESDDHHGRRKHHRHPDDTRMSESNEGGGGGGGLPSYLSAKKGQGMFSHQTEADQNMSAIPYQQQHSQHNQPPAPKSEVVTSSRRPQADTPPYNYPAPPTYTAPPPRQSVSTAPSIQHSREDSGFDQDDSALSSRSQLSILAHDGQPGRPIQNRGTKHNQEHVPQSGHHQHHHHQPMQHPSHNGPTHIYLKPPRPAPANSQATNNSRAGQASSVSSSVGGESAYYGSDANAKQTRIPNGAPRRLSSTSESHDGQHPNAAVVYRNGIHPPTGRLSSQVDIMAVSELLNELDKLGKGARSSNRSVRSARSDRGSDRSHNQSLHNQKRKNSYNHQLPQYAAKDVRREPPPDFIPKQDMHRPPVKVLSNKRMSLTTQEILRVSRSGGQNHNMLTEL